MTQQEYIATLAARFPECVTKDGLARPDKLAERENAARRRHTERTLQTGASTNAAEVKARRLAWATILARISPVDSVEAADALGIQRKGIGSRMEVLERIGLAERIPGARPITWKITLPELAA
jgi:hypothetical protein